MYAHKWIIRAIFSILILISSVSLAKNHILPTGYDTDDANNIILEYEFTKPILDKQELFDLISINGLGSYHNISEPIIPMQAVSVLIPLGKKVREVRALPFETVELAGKYRLFPSQKPYPRSYVGPKEFTEPNAIIYAMNTPWPGTYCRKVSTQFKRGYQLQLINLFPVQFVPKYGKLIYAPKIRLEVELENTVEIPLVRPTVSVREQLKQQVDNPASLNSYANEQIKNIESLHKQKRKFSPIENISPKKLQKQAAFDRLSGQIKGVNSKERPRTAISKKGYLRFLSAPDKSSFRTDVGSKNIRESAYEFLMTNSKLFLDGSEAVDFKVKKESAAGPNKERRFIRHNQTYAGLEVFGAEVIVQLDSQGGVVSVVSDIMQDTEALDLGEISLTPNINAKEAKARAVEFMSSAHSKLKFEATEPELMIYDPAVTGNQGQIQLVWKLEVANVGRVVVRELVLINAGDGTIALHYSLINNAMHRVVYEEVWPLGTPILEDPIGGGDDSNYPTGIYEYDKAYEYLANTYNFYYQYLRRDSYDDEGADVIATIDWEWDGACSYGDSMSIGKGNVTDDIIGHEFTHGVVAMTVIGESGAIEESLCDMFGEWIDLTNGSGNDSAEVRWRLFEDWRCWDPRCPDWGHWPDTPCRIWRVMDDPPSVCTDSSYGDDFGSLPQPDRYYSPYWYTGGQDSGGVHHNIGVGNKLCYLLTDGDSFNGYSIVGLGIEKASKVIYESLWLLPSAAEYFDFGQIVVQAAYNLTADGTIELSELNNVVKACASVEIYDSPVLSIPGCPFYAAPADATEFKYVIITSQALANSMTEPNFRDLCDSKAEKGISACIVTTEWIYGNYDGNRPDANSDNQTKIRNFLIDAYKCWGIEYCLLGGSEDIIPGREFFKDSIGDYPTYPSDLYYSCLDPNCTFDSSGNGQYAEPGSNGDEMDLLSEIYVGRACVESADEVHSFVYKNFKYLESTDSNYLNNFSAFAVYLNSGFMKPYAEYIRVHSDYQGIDRVGFETRTLPNSRNFDISQYVYDYDYYYCGGSPCDKPLPEPPEEYWNSWATLLPILNGDNGYTTPHIIYFAGHGTPFNIFRGVEVEGNSELIEVESEVAPDLDDLTNDCNDRYFFWYLDSCLSGRFTEEECFVEELTTRANGAFAVIASTQTIDQDGDYWPATKLCCEFFDLMLDNYQNDGVYVPSLGYALQTARENTLLNEALTSSVAHLAYCEMTLFGDPELSLRMTVKVRNVTRDLDYETIQDAINEAVDGDEIIVSPGTYHESIDFKGLSIKLRSVDPYNWDVVESTIIYGSTPTTPVVSFIQGEDSDSVISGFTIKGDKSCIYGAIRCSNSSSPVIRNCIIEDAVYGVSCSFGSAAILNNKIRNNNTGIKLAKTTATIKNNWIYNNPKGIELTYDTTCTINNNTITDSNVCGIDNGRFSPTPIITSCILWDNADDLHDSFSATYSCIEDAADANRGDDNHNITINPLFVDSDNENYHLADNSPCIDTGYPDYTPEDGEIDIDGDDRVVLFRAANVVDMGADEVFHKRVERKRNGQTVKWYSNIQPAIAEADDGEELIVCPGAYYENIDFDGKAITLRSTNPYDWDVVAATIIDGNDSGSVVTFDSSESQTSIISGFTIQNGLADVLTDGYYAGSGIFCYGSSPEISNCIIKDNGADLSGVDGGGIACYNNANPTITNCIIADNTAEYAAGTSVWASSPEIRNCIISGNSADYGGGVYCFEDGDANIANCTVVNNTAISGGGVFNDYSNPTITNCIFWSNTSGQINGYPNPTVTYSCIEGGYTGTGNIDSDPCFADADFHLGNNSPCIDIGNPNGDYEGQTDIDGNIRINYRVDIGADEAIYRVRNNNKDIWYNTIQSAVDSADNDDTLVIYPGVHIESVLIEDRPVELKSINPDNLDVIKQTVIRYDGTADNVIKIKEISGVKLKGLTIDLDSSQANGVYLNTNANNTIVDKCIIQNSGWSGSGWSGIFNDGGQGHIISNCWIYNCSFGIRSLQSLGADLGFEVYNTTIVGTNYGITTAEWWGVVKVVNCIIWDSVIPLSGGNFIDVSYSCITGYPSGPDSYGNIGSDPCFVDIYNDDFHLGVNSPCIDVGDPNGNYGSQTDIDGDDRVIDISGKGDGTVDVDMGADEYKP